jgi:hypothetical protein
MTRCAICGAELPTAASEYGREGSPAVCLNDWMAYVEWQQRVDAKADEIIACHITLTKGAEAAEYGELALLEHEGQIMSGIGYEDYVALASDADGWDWASDVLEEYDLLPAHVTAADPLNPPVGPSVMDPDRSPQNREAAGW